jgi:hypothetical protein
MPATTGRRRCSAPGFHGSTPPTQGCSNGRSASSEIASAAAGRRTNRTPDGLRWIDFDTVCRGPVEWDLAHLPHEAVTAFPEADLELLDAMRALQSAEVAIWCWHSYGRAPEVDEAAHLHLQRVRDLY